MKFRLWTILWVFALFASGMATFDPVMAIPLILVIFYTWEAIFQWFKRPGFTLVELFMVFAVWVILYCLFTPAIMRSYEPERVADCRSKMKRAVRSILEYRKSHGSLPRGGIFTNSNESVHSWRALLLRQQNDATEYDFDRPWDDPRNTIVAGNESPGLCCRNDSYYARDGTSISTSYFAVIGPSSAWAAWSSEDSEFTDEPSQTILLIEQLNTGTAWCEPKDLTEKEALKLLTTDPKAKRGNYSLHYGGESRFFAKQPLNGGGPGAHIAFADGTVRFAFLPLSQEFATALLTANGGETISDADFESLWMPELNYARIYSFSVFVVLSLLPAIKSRKKQPTNAEPAD